MSDLSIYNEDAYRKFAEELSQALKGPNIRYVDLDWLEPRVKATGVRTKFGSYGWRSAISSRIAPKTVYLGSQDVRLPRPSAEQQSLIVKAPEELDKVLHLMRTLPFYHIRRQMGQNELYNPICNLYVSSADLINYRLGYMWGTTLFKPSRRPGPEFIMIHIPEEHPLRQQVLVLPEFNINIALGTDYMGEDKKGFLRQSMWTADQKGMLGLHAGTKIVTARDPEDKLKTYGVFLFGLTATGKSTWSCHQLGLDHKRGEKTLVTQDDIVFLRNDGSAFGSENNFFVKTDVEKKYQEAMYNTLTDKSALMENVMIKANGEIDFMDESLTANGRAVVQRKKLQVDLDGKMVDIFSKSIDLPPLEELDGLIFAFITRRNTIMSFAQELTPEQAVLAYLWGESTHSYASQPLKAGESVRIVGTDPFIIGSRAKKVNRFYEIIMTLVSNHPGKLKFVQYNTGGIGEIIETSEEDGQKKKRLIRKVKRVPINLMAQIQRGDLRETNRYEKGRLGTKEIKLCEGKSLDEWDIRHFYSEEQIQGYIKDLVDGRQKFTEEIVEEGLRQEIQNAAERSFKIERSEKKAKVFVPGTLENEQEAPEKPVSQWETKTRPRRERFWRER
ncbi:MAG: phosphoenolpyruvate carboxykinase (ATP) [Candidatus Aminicenantes bacterium]|nr:phosphoenolpyruvate carboxykinase (ATP) [Candidatus Aminicenantes bacterium]MDH5383149.1 phosphoenolpyruvate carboxykinase (ATP) [Candidatus Aminicenantes bacterium]MDH5742189.1 phosphoenolpyruvate carboxykinase (ATP) [Candidatus Aminicenantes bacterium]